jgi:hypothetical protein
MGIRLGTLAFAPAGLLEASRLGGRGCFGFEFRRFLFSPEGRFPWRGKGWIGVARDERYWVHRPWRQRH